MRNKLSQFAVLVVARAQLLREEGQALVEYTLILALVSVVAIALLTSVGKDIETVLKKVVEALEGV